MKKLVSLFFIIFLLHAHPSTTLTCEQSDKDDCNDRGVTYGINGEFSKAFKLYEKSCELNSSRGCSNLGFIYINGEGINKSFALAEKYLRKAIVLGDHSLATTNLGVIYATGYSNFKKDKTKAMHYFKLGCEKYNNLSCHYMGRLENEKGDREKAFYYYERGCVLGNGASCLQYGVALYSGHGTKIDKEVALYAFSLGCKFENASACEALTGMVYKAEGGALPDIKLVEVYRKRACDFGAKYACGEDEEYYRHFD